MSNSIYNQEGHRADFLIVGIGPQSVLADLCM